MFGSTRKKAVATTVENLKPIIGSYQHGYGIPVGFWQSPYVIGFFSYLIGLHLKMASRGSLSPIDNGRAIVDVFSELSHENGVAITTRQNELVSAHDSEFNLGADNATAMVSGGRLTSSTPTWWQRLATRSISWRPLASWCIEKCWNSADHFQLLNTPDSTWSLAPPSFQAPAELHLDSDIRRGINWAELFGTVGCVWWHFGQSPLA